MGCCSCLSSRPTEEKTIESVFDEEYIVSTAEISNKVYGAPSLCYTMQPAVSMKQGQVKDFYRNIEIIAEGSYSKVYKAECSFTGERRAIKSIMKSMVTRSDGLFAEVQILRQLDHPNILRILEIIETQRYYHIISELCEGGELFDRIINAKTLTERQAANYLYQLLAALNHCHSQGIIHKDIKPENLLFRENSDESSLVVIDFGVSDIYNSSSGPSKKAYGTAWYAAPEALRGNYTAASDVWSCGIVLYVMLSGRHPFPHLLHTGNQPLGPVQFGGPEWDSVSAQAKALIAWMLDSDASKRPTPKQAMESKWMAMVWERKVDRQVQKSSLRKLSHFRRTAHLTHAILEFMVAHYSRKAVLNELQNAFVSMDADNNGTLSREELNLAAQSVELLDLNIEEIIDHCDANKNGIIEYREFLTAAAKKCLSITNEKLEHAFQAFDRDGNGVIDVEELKHVLGDLENCEDQPWELWLSEIDLNGDGVIDVEEFKLALLEEGDKVIIEKFIHI